MPITISEFFSNGFVGKYYLANIEKQSSTVFIIIAAAIIMICAYLLGSINFAIIISGRKYHEDIRAHGSKNAGMTNMMRTYGRTAAAFTLLGDALKAITACLFGYALIGQLGAYIAGVFCILGHVFPIFYRFKGGKGVVTAFATILMCDPFIFLILFLLFVLIVLFTKFISLGSILCMLLYPILLDRITRFVSRFSTGEASTSPYIIFTVIIAAIIVVKHWGNIKRLSQGTENKFSFKKSVKISEEEIKECND